MTFFIDFLTSFYRLIGAYIASSTSTYVASCGSVASVKDVSFVLSGTRLCTLRLVTLLVACLETALLLLTGLSLTAHKEWWVVMPLFAACALILWAPLHLVQFLVSWKLWSKVSDRWAIFTISLA